MGYSNYYFHVTEMEVIVDVKRLMKSGEREIIYSPKVPLRMEPNFDDEYSVLEDYGWEKFQQEIRDKIFDEIRRKVSIEIKSVRISKHDESSYEEDSAMDWIEDVFPGLIDELAESAEQGAAEVAASNPDYPADRTALTAAIEANAVDRVGDLIKHGVDINAVDPRGVIPLILANLLNHTRIADMLVAAGASIEKSVNDVLARESRGAAGAG